MNPRIAVVGVGGWGKNHVRVLKELGALVAVCDTNPSRALEFSDRYGVHGYSGVDELIAKEEFDAAVIATPTSTHREVALKLIDAHKHVFVEKPIAPNVQEAKEIVDAAARAGVILAAGYIERFNPAVSELKSMMDSGKTGLPLFAEFHRENRRPVHISDVGILHDTAVHDIDTARWLLGEPRRVYARLSTIVGPKEDYAVVVLEFDGPKVAVITANWITPKKERRMTVVFSDSIATVDFVAMRLTLDDDEGRWEPRIQTWEPLKAELDGFMKAISGSGGTVVSGADALRTTALAEAAERSARLGSPIEVS
ncbi:MAG: Gfo/Idh/MocA family protein [Conexivisphaera sp.]